tara:strand:+ start:115 stop:438 length:324 start_codon:yes stop_codon:yes gene_type:complete
MIYKKIIFGLFTLCFLGACSSPTAMIGPAYTFTSTGNIFQASLNYGSNQMVTKYTGKTPIQNLREISSDNENRKKNYKKETLESEDFYFLVKNKIEKTGALINFTNQ